MPDANSPGEFDRETYNALGRRARMRYLAKLNADGDEEGDEGGFGSSGFGEDGYGE